MAKEESTYAIIDWIIDNAPVMYHGALSFTKKSDFLSNLQDIAAQEKVRTGLDRLERYVNRSLDDTSKITGRNISDEIETNNENWKQTLLSDVDKAKTEDDIGTVRQGFNAEKDKYEDATMTEVENALINKETEILEGVAPGIIKGLEKQIKEAKTFEDIGKIPLEDLPPGPQRTRLAEQIKEQQAKPEFVTQEEFVEETILEQIGEVTTIEQLRAIDAGEGITGASREILREAIEARREEL